MSAPKTTPTQAAVLALAARCGAVYRNGSRVFGYTPTGAKAQVRAHGNTVLILVRRGQLVRNISPYNVVSYTLPQETP